MGDGVSIKGIRELETIRAEALSKRSDGRHHQAAYLAFRQAEIDTAFSIASNPGAIVHSNICLDQCTQS